MKNMIIISFPYDTEEEYEAKQKQLLREVIAESLSELRQSSPEDRFLTRKQVAQRLHISLPTLHSLTKDGTLTGYRLNGRVLYKEVDVLASLRRIESNTTRRAQ